VANAGHHGTVQRRLAHLKIKTYKSKPAELAQTNSYKSNTIFVHQCRKRCLLCMIKIGAARAIDRESIYTGTKVTGMT